eukprot:Nk52_evm5s634 gene=Nk52_evmTU5s634
MSKEQTNAPHNENTNRDPPCCPPPPSSHSDMRQDYLSWGDYFMAVAFLSSQRSKDPSTQVGACIVNQDKRIVGIGYNGMPRGCEDNQMPWGRGKDYPEKIGIDSKYLYVCHAELNAILNKNTADVMGCTLYTALFPCNECAKLILQSGIKEVVYYSDKYADKLEFRASRHMFDVAGVKYRQHIPERRKIVIDFENLEPKPVEYRDSNNAKVNFQTQ